MCDYSLHHVATTPAKVGESLVTTQFEHSITRGFCAVGAPGVAVCIPSGAELSFEREVEQDRLFFFMRRRKMGGRLARFCQIDMDNPNTHHDALEFPNGKIVLLTELAVGQRASVLQLPPTGKERIAKPQQTGDRPMEPRNVF